MFDSDGIISFSEAIIGKVETPSPAKSKLNDKNDFNKAFISFLF